MEALLEFLKTNYIYFVFVAVLLILALIGYIIDSSNTIKKKQEDTNKSDEEEFVLSIPEIGNAKIGETVNKNAGIEPVKEESQPTNPMDVLK